MRVAGREEMCCQAQWGRSAGATFHSDLCIPLLPNPQQTSLERSLAKALPKASVCHPTADCLPKTACACSHLKPGISKLKETFASSSQGFEGFLQPQELWMFISPAQSL